MSQSRFRKRKRKAIKPLAGATRQTFTAINTNEEISYADEHQIVCINETENQRGSRGFDRFMVVSKTSVTGNAENDCANWKGVVVSRKTVQSSHRKKTSDSDNYIVVAMYGPVTAHFEWRKYQTHDFDTDQSKIHICSKNIKNGLVVHSMKNDSFVDIILFEKWRISIP